MGTRMMLPRNSVIPTKLVGGDVREHNEAKKANVKANDPD